MQLLILWGHSPQSRLVILQYCWTFTPKLSGKNPLSVCTRKWERLGKHSSGSSLEEMCWTKPLQLGSRDQSNLIWISRFTLVRARIIRTQNSHTRIPTTYHSQTNILHSLPRHSSHISQKLWWKSAASKMPNSVQRISLALSALLKRTTKVALWYSW